ncbi:MAG TPA: metallophosphoesterase [Allosphingosinicella sp.]|nr:metallophosphoesterase [Allosphingosinicella sp.]
MTFKRFLLILAALAILLLGWCYWSAIADPVVRRATIALPGYPAGQGPVKVALISDLHVQGPDMPPERLARIVAQINAEQPDLVLIAGDLVGSRTLSTRHYTADETVAPLAGLRARLGTIAVLGNHEHWEDPRAMRDALTRIGVRVLANDAVRAGPLVIGGLDDQPTGHNRDNQTYAAMRALPGARVLLSHGPDTFATLPPDIGLMLAGHTHCGQIVLPLYGPLQTPSFYGDRYMCGYIEQNGRKLIVTAGLGASVLPLRLLAPPDFWIVTLGRRAAR